MQLGCLQGGTVLQLLWSPLQANPRENDEGAKGLEKLNVALLINN